MKTTVFIDNINSYCWFSAACKFNINGVLLIILLIMHCYFIDTSLFFMPSQQPYTFSVSMLKY
jgi:hypothetical protein